MNAATSQKQVLALAWLKSALELVSTLGGNATIALQKGHEHAVSFDGCSDALARIIADHVSNRPLGDVPTSEVLARVQRWEAGHRATLVEFAKDATAADRIDAERSARTALMAPLSPAQLELVLDWLNHALWLLTAIETHAVSAKHFRPEAAPAFRACADALAGVIQSNVGDRSHADVAWSDFLAQVILWEAEHSAALTELTKYEDVRQHFAAGSSAALVLHLEHES